MAESFVDSFKTELIEDRTFQTRTQLELAVVEYIAWFNNDRLHENLGDIPPAEFEALGAERPPPATPTRRRAPPGGAQPDYAD
jgi:transposase InsO family protein